jgi:Zn ribbon nucleic-acid-binding protein
MPECTKCGHHASRKHRNVALKLVSRASFHCDNCGNNLNFFRPVIAIFERWAQCPLCHNRDLTKLRKADKVDRVSSNLLRGALRFIGCPLYHCTFCRYQFRDWRPLAPPRAHTAPSATIAKDAFKTAGPR